MKVTDDTDSRIRKFFRKICRRLDAQGVRYNENTLFRLAIIFEQRGFSSKEIADSFVCGQHELIAAAELN